MSCACPIVVKNQETGLRSEVRCGQCRSCRLRRKLAWVGRLLLEGMDHSAARFVTLTYAKDPGILDYRDFQLFMKRYRREVGDARFFAVGEYGGKTHRGHFHAIVYGQPARCRGFAPYLQKLWERGFCYDGTVTRDSIGYVAGYVFKENYTEEKRPFVHMSLKPGIGLSRIRELGSLAATQVRALNCWPSSIRVGARSYPLCDGGLAAWQDSYLEHGGLPPPISNPMVRHEGALERMYPTGGSRVLVKRQEETSRALHARYNDGSALKKER